MNVDSHRKPEATDSPIAGVAGGCEPPDMGGRNQIRVLQDSLCP